MQTKSLKVQDINCWDGETVREIMFQFSWVCILKSFKLRECRCYQLEEEGIFAGALNIEVSVKVTYPRRNVDRLDYECASHSTVNVLLSMHYFLLF